MTGLRIVPLGAGSTGHVPGVTTPDVTSKTPTTGALSDGLAAEIKRQRNPQLSLSLSWMSRMHLPLDASRNNLTGVCLNDLLCSRVTQRCLQLQCVNCQPRVLLGEPIHQNMSVPASWLMHLSSLGEEERCHRRGACGVAWGRDSSSWLFPLGLQEQSAGLTLPDLEFHKRVMETEHGSGRDPFEKLLALGFP